MDNIDCLCVILTKNSNPLKGRLYFINFYLLSIYSSVSSFNFLYNLAEIIFIS